jgi:hypothetical protein
MEYRKMPQMHEYGESKITQIMVATVQVCHVTSGSGLRNFLSCLIFVEQSIHIKYS